ncbi:MAG: DUF3052 domain-containing protein [Pseudomonadota bacterium]
MAGYSGTPLSKKLGFKPGGRVKTVSAPKDYGSLVAPLPDGVLVSARLNPPVDVLHIFCKSQVTLVPALKRAVGDIHQDGTIWVSWPKQTSGVTTDLNREIVRDLALKLPLVDVKVCAVDETWSGLKFVIRKKFRK